MPTFAALLVMVVVEWINRERKHGLDLTDVKHRWLRWAIYYMIIIAIYYYQPAESAQFIYFQF